MLTKAKEGIEKSIKHLDNEFAKLQLGRANSSLVEDVKVEQYGSVQLLKNVSSVSILDPQTLSIKPWDRNIIWTIAKAINDSGLWLNPQSMADSVILKIPALTTERRTELTKIAKKMSEEAKIWVRNARQDSLKDIKKASDDKLISEDIVKQNETDLQKLIDEANKKIDETTKKKEADIMKV